MKKSLSRRDMLSRAGLAIGGAMTLGVLQACSNDDDPAPLPDQGACPEPQVCQDTAAALKDYPYEKFVPSDFVFDAAAVKQAAYHAYYAGGCCHGSYSALLGDLVRSGAAPFTQLPIDYGRFGGGGIAAYGSICGAVLGSILIVNSVVANAGARANLMTNLMRWYEGFPFPEYAPTTVDTQESAATKLLDWGTEPTKPPVTQVAPGSHLCHASVSGWCARQVPMVNAGTADQPDKKARCARLTADVAGKTVEMLNQYLASGALGARSFAVLAPGASVTGCTSCHGGAVGTHGGADVPPVASGMSCPSCHTTKAPLDPTTHSTLTTCATCHGGGAQ